MVRLGLFSLFCVLLPAFQVTAFSGKRGLVGVSCNESALFISRAKNWYYNYAVRLSKLLASCESEMGAKTAP